MVQETQEEVEKRREQLSKIAEVLDRGIVLKKKYAVTMEGLDLLELEIAQEQERRTGKSGK